MLDNFTNSSKLQRGTDVQYSRQQLHTYRDGLILLVLCLLESFLILLANTTVFVLIIKHKKLRRKNNYCLISLAISDFLTGLVALPLVIACQYDMNACTPMDLSQRFLSFSTILHLLVATSERYFKIRYPLRYKYYVTGARIGLILVAVWAMSLAFSLIQLTWINHTEEERYYDFIFSTSCVVAFAFLPFVITVAANVHVLWIIHKEKEIRYRMVQHERSPQCRKGSKRRSNERKAVLVYLAMTVSFMVGFLPYFILTFMADMQEDVGFGVSLFFLILRFTAPLVDPLLYTFFKTDFKSAFIDMVGKPLPSTERTVQTRV
ncbi:octopamine receptor beta-1R-like [Actinia tenebrosa]|uniref:Octopamine receptor beta-1R-like n=1 Tax=Actinia tenebrosa TaxID=6105 RepID=A0A6P8IF59_ACTTE|nr:octopamine receptor beta-1R-like [Actinia tenebrosa]